MNRIKLLHSADFHIGSSRAHLSDGNYDALAVFAHACDICREDNTDFFLIAGDLFDSPYPNKAFVRETFERISALSSDVIVVSGNHDFACEGSVWKTVPLPSNLRLFDRGITALDFPEKDTCIWGAGFNARYSDGFLPNGFSVSDHSLLNIGVLHADISSVQSRYAPISAEQIADCGLDYLALGHIHKRSRIDRIGTTYCSYCGSPLGRGFDETGAHGVYLGELGKDFCDLKFREIPNSMYLSVKIDISGADTAFAAANIILGSLYQKYGTDFSDNLYRITLCGTADFNSFNTATLSAALGNKLKFCELTDRTSSSERELAALSRESSLRGIFVTKMLEKIQNADSAEGKNELISALRLGVSAFETEVMPYEN